MQAEKFTFVQTDRQQGSTNVDWNADFSSCPGQFQSLLAKYLDMSTLNPLFVLDKLLLRKSHFRFVAHRNPPRIKGIDAVLTGTSGAESSQNDCAMAAAPSHRRARRGASVGLLAAQRP
jgi:hypothetical protein